MQQKVSIKSKLLQFDTSKHSKGIIMRYCTIKCSFKHRLQMKIKSHFNANENG